MTAGGPRVAIAGAGLMGRWHAYYAARAGGRVVAVIDRDERAARALGARFPQARLFTDLEDCLAQATVEAVHLCTPAGSHVPLATTALAVGKHVLVEKPLAPTLVETERLIALARRADLLLTPVHQFPFQRGFQRLRHGLARLGELVRLEFVTCTAGGEGLAGRARRALLLDLLPHPLSLFRALLPAPVGRVAWDLLALTDDDLELRGTLGGVRVAASISLRGRPTRNGLTVTGTAGTAHTDLFHGYSLVETGRASRRTKLLQPFAYGGKVLGAAGGNLLWRAVHAEPAYPGLSELIARFYRAVARGGPAPVGDREMLDVAALRERLARVDGRGR